MFAVREILLTRVGRDTLTYISEFLPFEFAFRWFYPNLDGLKARYANLTNREQFDFFYSILPFDRYKARRYFQVGFYQQALNDGCHTRLEILKSLTFDKSQLRITNFKTICISTVQWILDNQVDFDIWDLIDAMLRKKSYTECAFLARLIPPKAYVGIERLDCPEAQPAALRWFFEHKEVLHIQPLTKIQLDDKSPAVIRLWLELAPLSKHQYIHNSLIDYTETVELLNYYFHTFVEFNYSTTAIALAIEDDAFDRLEWWTQKAAMESVRLKLPRWVHVPRQLSAATRVWALNHDVELIFAT